MVGNLFVGHILMGLGSRPAKAAAEVELQPMQPGVWAAWARSHSASQDAAAAPAAKASTTNRVRGTLPAAGG